MMLHPFMLTKSFILLLIYCRKVPLNIKWLLLLCILVLCKTCAQLLWVLNRGNQLKLGPVSKILSK